MAEYFAKDDLIKDLEYLESLGCDSLPLREMRERIEYGAVKAVDAAQVVRCKECKHKGWIQEPCHGRPVDFCRVWDSCVDNLDGFCSYGERKDGGVGRETD